MRVITVGNQKGGVGKTQVAANLAGALAEGGARVLAIDLDSQAQLHDALGARDLLEYDDSGALVSYTIADLLNPPRRNPPSLWEVRLETKWAALHLIPASSELDQARRALEDAGPRGLLALHTILNDDAVSEAYDYVVIDTAPRLDRLLDTALTGADYVVCVTGADMQQMEPAIKFAARVQDVREQVNPNVELLGLLYNRLPREWTSSERTPALAAEAGLPVFETRFRQLSKFASSFLDGPVVFVAPNSREAELAREFAAELVERIVAAEAGEGK